MENGHDGKLAEKFSGLAINQQHGQQGVHDQSNLSSNHNESLYQVMKAVEAAEVTIKQQVLMISTFRCMLRLMIGCCVFFTSFLLA